MLVAGGLWVVLRGAGWLVATAEEIRSQGLLSSDRLLGSFMVASGGADFEGMKGVISGHGREAWERLNAQVEKILGGSSGAEVCRELRLVAFYGGYG